MRSTSVLWPVVAAATLLTSSQAYMIDASCGSEGSDELKLVQAMVDGAFNMIDAAMVAVNNQDSFTQNLQKMLFGDSGADGTIITKTFEATTQANPESCGVLSFRDKKGTREECTPKDVIIYCNTDRLTEREDGWYNKLGKWVSTKWDCGRALAITTPVDGQPDELQICPWFFDYAKGKYNTEEDIEGFRKKAAFIKGGQQLVSKIFNYKTIDAFSLFDKVLVHEFTHTKAGGRKNDEGGFLNAYGWPNCLKLGSEGTGVTNADSYALFCSAAYNAKDGVFVKEDGTFTSEQSGAGDESSKRSVSIAERAWIA